MIQINFKDQNRVYELLAEMTPRLLWAYFPKYNRHTFTTHEANVRAPVHGKQCQIVSINKRSHGYVPRARRTCLVPVIPREDRLMRVYVDGPATFLVIGPL